MSGGARPSRAAATTGLLGVPLRGPGEEAAQEVLALLHLVEGDELVGLVRLLDRAGAADHGRDAGLLVEPALGGEADFAKTVGAAEALRELHDLVIGRRAERRRVVQLLEDDGGLRPDALHLRQERRGEFA